MDRSFQRRGAKNNSDVGRIFEVKARQYFTQIGIELTPDYSVDIGFTNPKPHKFDLGSMHSEIIVECKSHKWTAGGNPPSAKLTVWDQAMFFFHLAPSKYRKILFVLRDYSQKHRETLGNYYLRNRRHLIPSDVEIWEFDEKSNEAEKIS